MSPILVCAKEKCFSFIENHVFSIEFWRLIAFVGKRLISTAKLFAKIAYIFSIVNYFLNFLRAVLRIISFFSTIKNKNLGETRKVLFSSFKVIISLIAFILCFFMPVPAALGIAFLFYSLAKLLDSTIIFIFSFIAYVLIDKEAENTQGERDQYLQNVIKHSSILTIALPMTLLTGLMMVGSPGVMCFAVATTTLFLVTYIACLSYLFYQYFSLNDCEESVKLKQEYLKNIKSLLIDVLILVLFLAITITALFFPIPVVITGLSIKLLPVVGLALLNLLDVVKGIYYYLPNNKNDSEPLGMNYDPNTAITQSGYYATKNIINYLAKPKDSKDNVKILLKNKEILIREWLLKTTDLQNKINKIQAFPLWKRVFYHLEEKKLNVKIEDLTNNLAVFLKNKPFESYQESLNVQIETILNKSSDFKADEETKKAYFIDLLLKTNADLKLESMRSRKIGKEWDKPDNNSNELTPQQLEKQCEWQIHNFINRFNLSGEENTSDNKQILENNLLWKMWRNFVNQQITQPMEHKLLHQSFFKQTGDCTALNEAIHVATKIENEVLSNCYLP